MTAQRLAHTLNAHGHEVRVVSTGNSGNGKYLVKEYFLPPIVHHIVTKQGMVFAKPDEEVLKEAIGGGSGAFPACPSGSALGGCTSPRKWACPIPPHSMCSRRTSPIRCIWAARRM